MTNALVLCMCGPLRDASDKSEPCIVVVIDDVAPIKGVVGGVGTLRKTELGWRGIRPARLQPLAIFDFCMANGCAR